MATDRTERKYKKSDLEDIVNDASERFERPKSEVRVIVRKEAKNIGLI